MATLELLQSEISEKEPVLARLGITNLGFDTVEMNPPPGQYDITLIRQGADGVSRSFQIPQLSGMVNKKSIKVEPGHKWTTLLVLNQWTTDWPVGSFDLTLTWKQPVYESRWREPFAPGTIVPQRLQVVPYDRRRLENRLQYLVHDWRETANNNPYESWLYQCAIASVRDPVAIPFLRQFRPFDTEGLEALAAIGTEEALDVFIANWAQLPVEEDDIARMIFRGLFRRMHAATKDPELKKRIETACNSVPEKGPQRRCP